MGRKATQLTPEWVESKTMVSDRGCWEWIGPFRSDGYGNASVKNKSISAHRASWVAHFGSIPEGLCVLHKCDNRKCINPDHLFLGTYQDNQDDCTRKGRNGNKWKHSRPVFSHLTADQVTEIHRLYHVEHVLQREIGARFGLTQTGVHRIVMGKNWKEFYKPTTKENQ